MYLGLIIAQFDLFHKAGQEGPQGPYIARGLHLDAIKEREFNKGTPPDQPQTPAAGQKKQPEIKQPKSL